jgi:fimbrial isopeptide formation D2 family protein/LPXTG-motif cell wall-anchored protein
VIEICNSQHHHPDLKGKNMKVRKGMSVLGALALMVSGAAAGIATVGNVATAASAASAAEPNAGTHIKVSNSDTQHVYSAYALATFTGAVADESDATKIKHIDIDTVPSEVKGILTAADIANGDASLPSEYVKNPAAYVATFTAAQLRVFADVFEPTGPVAASVQGNGKADEHAVIANLPAEGWYFVTETLGADASSDPGTTVSAPGGHKGDQAGPSAIVASTVGKFASMDLDRDAKQSGVTELGVYYAKAEAISIPGKEVNGANSAKGVGDTLSYTLTGEIPQDVASYGSYAFKFIDTPGKGLTVDMDSLKVSVGGEAGELKQGNDYMLAPVDDFAGDGKTTFTVDLTTWVTAHKASNAGALVTVTYTATINEEAAATVSNSVAVQNNSTTVPGGIPVDVAVGSAHFTKVGVDGDSQGLGGAHFTISDSKGRVLHVNPAGSGSDGKYVIAEKQAEGTTDLVSADSGSTSGSTGIVDVHGLAQGEYTVQETDAPVGYLDTVKAEFIMTVDKDGNASVTKDILGLVDPGTATVRNVKSLTQLPLTGSVGITAIVLLGVSVLGGGSAALVHTRRRAREV